MRRPRLNADALIEACQDLLDSGSLGSKHQQRPHVLVTVDAAEYRAGLGGLLHLPGTDAEPITAATVDQYLCDADVTTILTRPADRPTRADHARTAATRGCTTRPARSSTSAAPAAPHPRDCARPSRSATSTASSPAAASTPAAATPTTSPNGPTTASPTRRTCS